MLIMLLMITTTTTTIIETKPLPRLQLANEPNAVSWKPRQQVHFHQSYHPIKAKSFSVCDS
jgi:hypothetical protein